MKLKIVEVDGKQYAEVLDGKPVFTGDDGKNIAFDAVGTRDTITRLNAEAKSHRTRAEAAETAVAAFEGISDPAAARKALETVSNLDQKRLVDAGQVEQANAERDKAWQARLDASDGKAQTFEKELYAEKVDGSFARSKFIADKFAAGAQAGADIARSLFRDNLKVEDGKVVGYDGQGQKIFSRSRPGELADFDEAIETLVSQYPHRDHILKSSGALGGGAPNGNGQPQNTKGNFGGGKDDRVAAIKAMTATN